MIPNSSPLVFKLINSEHSPHHNAQVLHFPFFFTTTHTTDLPHNRSSTILLTLTSNFLATLPSVVLQFTVFISNPVLVVTCSLPTSIKMTEIQNQYQKVDPFNLAEEIQFLEFLLIQKFAALIYSNLVKEQCIPRSILNKRT